MRSRTCFPVAVALVLLALAVPAFSQSGDPGLSSEKGETVDKAAPEEKAAATEEEAPTEEASDTAEEAPTEEASDTAEEAKPVTATLTYFESDEKGGATGAKKTMEVPYLPEGNKVAILVTEKGTVTIELWEDRAPNTVVNFAYLANSGRYDGVEFHRVIDGFMAQTGDVEHKGGFGGPGYTIPAEFNADLNHVKGVVSMARSNDPDSGGSQFFIMLASATHLDGKYAAFGQVVEGMDVIDSIKKGDQADNGAVAEPDKIVSLRVESIPSAPSTPEE